VSVFHFFLFQIIFYYLHTMFYLSIHQLMDIWCVSACWFFLLLWITLIWLSMCLFWHMHIFTSLVYISKSGIAGSCGNSVFNYKLKNHLYQMIAQNKSMRSPMQLYHFIFLPVACKCWVPSHPHQHSFLWDFFDYNHPNGCNVVSCYDFDLQFLYG
jgi:hypothetical protein